MKVTNLGILLRVHQRHEWLRPILDQMCALSRGRNLHLVIMADRPSAKVISALNRWMHHQPGNVRVTLLESPEPLRTSQGCRWTSTMKFMYERLRADGVTQAAMLWDDDIQLTTLAFKELREHLDDLKFDRVEVDWLQCLNAEATQHDTGFLRHRSACLFRVYEDDNWSDVFTNRVVGGGVQCPHYVGRSNKSTTLEGKVLHMGYCSPSRREEAWQAAKASGQMCGYFRQLSRPAVPAECVGQSETLFNAPGVRCL